MSEYCKTYSVSLGHLYLARQGTVASVIFGVLFAPKFYKYLWRGSAPLPIPRRLPHTLLPCGIHSSLHWPIVFINFVQKRMYV